MSVSLCIALSLSLTLPFMKYEGFNFARQAGRLVGGGPVVLVVMRAGLARV